ncbi:hypothetical protein HPO96_23995 [Kribbella sandramycini]|nr:Calx-beta domain-containing protein [Kribbella sandramycini]NOL43312.1 hypothetical protein [Kribbella sandramycini]
MVALLGVGTTLAPSAAAAPPDPPSVAEGNKWNVQQVPGGYRVSVVLDAPVPMRAALPQLAADGVPLGPARQSPDGRSLWLITTDSSVRQAKEIRLAEPGELNKKGRALSGPATDPYWLNPRTGPLLPDDPAKPGKYQVQTSEYNLGDEAVDLPGLRHKSEVVGKVYAPVGATGKRPLVIFQHGRHQVCYGAKEAPSDIPWPCAKGTKPVPSYRGYDGAANALASHGYQVVSISANAINAWDSDAYDAGAQARAELILEHLALWKKWSTTSGGPFGAKFVGKIDLTNVGLMGHSRGGEGVARAAVLNADRGGQYGIRAVLPLAPVDFARSTVPGVAMSVLLPYCDGDVVDLQGQKFYDDTRHSVTGDRAARSTVTVLGANHNFFNTEWTPGQSEAPSSDDWYGEPNEKPCGANYEGRLKPKEQQAVGTAYLAGFFRLQLGYEKQFLPLFDGSDARAASAGKAVVRVVAQAPLASRSDINYFDKPLPAEAISGKVTATVCAGAKLKEPAKAATQPCLETDGGSDAPHWTTSYLAASTPTLAVTKLSWTDQTGAVRINLAAKQRDVRKYAALSFRAAPDPTGAPKTDLSVRVVDGRGQAAVVPVSTVSDALTRLPGSNAEGLPKNLLRTVRIPLSSLKGVNLRDVRAVELRTDRVAQGSVYVSDLTFSSPGVGVSAPAVTLPKVSASNAGEFKEGDTGTQSADFVVTLNRPSARPITVYAESNLPWDTSAVGAVAKKLVFKPGQVRQEVSVPIIGNTRDAADVAQFSLALSAPQEALLDQSFGLGSVIDDDATPTLTIGNVTVGEQDGDVAFPMTLSAPSDRMVWVNGALKDGTAVLGQDYSSLWPPPDALVDGYIWQGETSGQVSARVLDDTVKEPAETFTAVLDTGEGGDVKLPLTVTATITDND